MEEFKLDEKTMSRLERFAREMERIRFADYVSYTNSPSRIIFVNFLGGLARGFGMAVGFTILAAVFILFLRRMVSLNLPLIGDWIIQLLELVSPKY
jgi:hypothetical protein